MNINNKFTNILLACAWTFFAYTNLQSFISTGSVTYLLFVIAQTELVFFFLIRKKPLTVSGKPSDALVAFLGSFIVLLYTPALFVSLEHPIYLLIGNLCIYVAVVLELFGALSLNRSYGIIPANRGVKTRGLYGYVRHPIYLGSLFLYIGYVMLNPSIFNIILLCVACVCQYLRIQAEERVLMQSEEYKVYAVKVKYRLVPFVY